MRHWALLHWFLLFVFCNACGGSPSLVTGPFGGATHRFRVDQLTLPVRTAGVGVPFADDFGDGIRHNQLAEVVGVIGLAGLQSQSIAAELAAGSIDLRVELVSEDTRLEEDASVGVRFLGGAHADGDQMGATLHKGKLVSNRIAEMRAPLSASISLPLFANADPVEWPLEAIELELTADGHGGFDGQLHAAAATAAGGSDALVGAAYPAFVQMVTAHPEAEGWAIHNFDSNRDGQISTAELAGNSWVEAAIEPDVQLHDATGRFAPAKLPGDPALRDALTVGVGFHLVACGDDACTLPPAAPRCDDRVRNGDESAVDCGGSCARCAAGLACVSDGDCQSGACGGGFCAPPTCSDGVRDGFETDIDCGPGCAPCAAGKQCFDDSDCAAPAICGGTSANSSGTSGGDSLCYVKVS